MKTAMFTVGLLLASGAALACTETGAFGVEFGKPVPKTAAAQQHSGGSVKNAMGCFEGTVPQPMTGMERHSYCANRDRKTVYALEASKMIDDKDAARAAIEAIRQAWEQEFGLKYQSDYDHGLSWTAETSTTRSRIYMFGPRLIVECAHKELEGKAFKAALQSW